jgi:hypothetical protein
MPSGNDAQFGIAVESAYGVRTLPTAFFLLNAEALAFEPERYFSPALGRGRWHRPSIITTKAGAGSISGDVPTTGFGMLLEGLHGNDVTPLQVDTSDAYDQEHELDKPPDKSYTIQVGVPPVTSAVLVPHDLIGVMFSGITFSWDPQGVLQFEIQTIVRDLDLDQELTAFTPPAEYGLFPTVHASLKIGGSPEGSIVGSGSVAIAFNLRADAFMLGGGGLIAKPVETDKPSATVTFTADFEDNAQLIRTLENTTADVVITFLGPEIDSDTHERATLEITVPDCVFTTNRAQVGGPGPVQDSVSATAASTSNEPVVIKYRSTDTILTADLPELPANTVPAAITGTTEVGSTLTVAEGTWTGYPAPVLTRKWQRSDTGSGGWSDVGETGLTYELAGADDTKYIRVLESAVNTSGTVTAPSNVVGAVTDP